MKHSQPLPDDPQLSARLREARVSPGLPPHFQSQVWRRIEAAEAPVKSGFWLDVLTQMILRPRFALAIAVVVLLAGILAGTLEGRQMARQDARMNYLAAVAPQAVR